MQTEWIFISKDGTCTTEKINISSLPARGDGKFHDGKEYEVLGTGTKMASKADPLVVAKEI